jgi:septal ring factor EnvC (AmiA/AmiB activator)
VQRYRVRPRETDQLVSQAENEIAAMRTLVKSAQQEYHKLGQQLFAANEKLREVDSDLHALQKSS